MAKAKAKAKATKAKSKAASFGHEAVGVDAASAATSGLRVVETHGGLAFRDAAHIADIAAHDERVITITQGKTLRVFDAASGAVLHTIERQRSSISCLALSPGGDRAYWSVHGEGVLVCDLAQGKAVGSIAIPDARTLAVSPDGKTLLVGCDRKVLRFDTGTLAAQKPLSGHRSQVNALLFLSNDAALSAGGDGVIKRHDLKRGKATAFGPAGRSIHAQTLSLSPDGSAVAYCQWGVVVVLDASTGDELAHRAIEHVGDAVFDPHTGRLWASAKGLIELDPRTLAEVSRVDQPRAVMMAVAPDSGLIACVEENAFETFVTRARDGSVHGPAHGHGDSIEGLAVGPRGLIVSASRDGTVRRFTRGGPAGGEVLLRGAGAGHVALSPDGKTALVCGFSRGPVRRIDLATGAHSVVIDDRAARASAYTPDGATVLVAVGNQLRTYDAVTLEQTGEVGRHRHFIESLALSPDGRSAVTGGQDGFLRVWDVPSCSMRWEIAGQTGYFVSKVMFTPDGASVYFDRRSGWMLCDTHTGQPQPFTPPWGLSPASIVGSRRRVFEARGNVLRARSLDEVEGESLTLGDQYEELTLVALSPDEHTLAVGGERGFVYRVSP